MPRLPVPGSDDGTWGDILNDYLNVSHQPDGSLKPVGINKGGTGALDASAARINLGLGNVNNTSDANKPVSTAQQAALDAKQDTLVSGTNIKTINGSSVLGSGDLSVAGGGVATNLSYDAGTRTVASDTGTDAILPLADGTNPGLMASADKTKLDGIETGAEVNDVTSVAGKTGVVTLTKTDVGLGNVDNTSDLSKPISTATQAALDAKAPLANNVSGDGSVLQVVQVTQAEYDALTPSATTMYVVVG